MSLEKRLWSGLLAVVGATAGFAAVVYFIGAATLWLALRAKDYSPDAAIEHQSKSQIIAVGLRGILFVAGIALFLAFAPIGRAMWRRRALSASTGIPPADPRPALRAGTLLLAFGLLLSASAVSWRVLTIAIATSAFLLLLLFSFRLWHAVAILLTAVLAAVSWQYGGSVNIRAAEVKPSSAQPVEGIFSEDRGCMLSDGTNATSWSTKVEGADVWIAERNPCEFTPAMEHSRILDRFREGCSVPYFGQTDEFVYLGAIRDVSQEVQGRCNWTAGPIVELKRDQILLRFPRGEVFLNPRDQRTPLGALWETLRSFVENVD